MHCACFSVYPDVVELHLKHAGESASELVNLGDVDGDTPLATAVCAAKHAVGLHQKSAHPPPPPRRHGC